METYIVEWLSLIFRWMHLITGVAWIGASFYFIWLDNSLENPPQWKTDKGIKGELWSIHGGGIYEVSKYQFAPSVMPAHLHWFKWEAYSTWLTGMVLLSVIYYFGADAYLIDKQVADLSQWQAIAIGLGFLIASWTLYELLCASPIAKNGYLIGGILILAVIGLAYALTHLFSGRGAYIHMGAIIGTIMVGNVFRVIMPSQRALISAIENQQTADPAWGIKAKLHSTHNTHLTLPLMFIMISSHYPFTYAHHYNWLILIALIVITATVRQYFVLNHKGVVKPAILLVAAAATIVLAFVLAPTHLTKEVSSTSAANLITNEQALTIVQQRCATCHSANPTDDTFVTAPGGVKLDSLDDITRWSGRIKARSIDTHDMPFMNKTSMSQAERNSLSQWLAR